MKVLLIIYLATTCGNLACDKAYPDHPPVSYEWSIYVVEFQEMHKGDAIKLCEKRRDEIMLKSNKKIGAFCVGQ